MKKILLLIGLLSTPSLATNIHVRSAATGANNGTSWTDAYTSFPSGSSYSRGDTIYVSSGSYGSILLDKSLDVSSTTITVKKATASDHGSSTGWSDTFSDGYATFNQILFGSSYWVVDGATGGGPGSWKTGFGIEVVISNGLFDWQLISTDDYGSETKGLNFLTVKHCYIHATGNYIAAPRVSGFRFSSGSFEYNDLTFSYNYITNLSGGPFFLRFGNRMKIEYNYVYHVGGVYYDHTEHSEVVVMWGENDFTFRYNYIWDSPSSGAIVKNEPDFSPPTPSSGVWVYGNVFRNANGAGSLVCNANSSCPNWLFANNTVSQLADPSKPIVENSNGPMDYAFVYNNIFSGAGISALYGIRENALESQKHEYNYLTGFVGGKFGNGGAWAAGIFNASTLYENGGRGTAGDATDEACDTRDGHVIAGGIDPFVNEATGDTPEDFKLTQHLPVSPLTYKDTGAYVNVYFPSDGIDTCQFLIDNAYPYRCDADHPFDVDMFGVTRGSTGGIWDRGAFQFTSADPVPPPAPPKLMGSGKITGRGRIID